MAIVPEYGAPQVAPTVGAGAQGASFVDYKAPKADTSGLVKGFNAYAAAFAQEKEETDEARATEVETDLRRKQLELLYDDQTGLMALKGNSAIQADAEGVSPLEQRMKVFDSYAQEKMVGLSADQQRLVKKQLQTLSNGMYASGMQHVMQENYNNKVSQATGAVLQAQQEAFLAFSDPDMIKSAVERAKAYGARVAKLKGLDAKSAMVEAEQGVHANVVYGYMAAAQTDPAQWTMAKRYLTANAAHMDGKTVFAFDSQITRGMMDYESQTTADDLYKALSQGQQYLALSGGSIVSKDGSVVEGGVNSAHYILTMGLGGDHWAKDASGRVIARETGGRADGELGYGAFNLTRSAAESVHGKMPEAVWEKSRANQQWNYETALAYLEKLGKKYGGDTDKALAAYVGSEKEVDEAAKRAEEKGGNWGQYLDQRTIKAAQGVRDRIAKSSRASVTDEMGNDINPFKARYATAAFRRPSYDELRASVEKSSPLAVNPYWVNDTAQKLDARFTKAQESFARERRQALDSVCQKLEQGATITPADLGQLTYQELNAFEEYKKRWETHDATGDLEYQTHLMANPWQIHAMDETQLRLAERIVPKSGRRALRKEWEKGHNIAQQQLGAQYAYQHGEQPKGETSLTATKVISILDHNEKFKKFGADQKLLVGQMISNAAEADNARFGEDTKGAKAAENYVLNWLNKEHHADSVFGFGNTYTGELKPIILFKARDFDNRARGVGKELGRRLYGREPSRGEYLEVLKRLAVRKDPQLDTAGVLSDAEVREITQGVRRAAERRVNRDWGNRLTVAQKQNKVEQLVAQTTGDSTKLLRAWLLFKLGVDLSEQ